MDGLVWDIIMPEVNTPVKVVEGSRFIYGDYGITRNAFTCYFIGEYIVGYIQAYTDGAKNGGLTSILTAFGKKRNGMHCGLCFPNACFS